jgi:hypothetical protein
MPIDKYFKGHGEEVKENMTKEYGAKKAERIFYATANKRKMNPGEAVLASDRKKKKAK